MQTASVLWIVLADLFMALQHPSAASWAKRKLIAAHVELGSHKLVDECAMALSNFTHYKIAVMRSLHSRFNIELHFSWKVL